MNLPILEKLKDGERFEFEVLAENQEQTELFWEWWWEKADTKIISRPETISNDDPILNETIGKTQVDLCSYSHFFNEFLTNALKPLKLPSGNSISRSDFREFLIRVVGSNSTKLQSRPQLIFAGGGYGSGKTTILSHLTESGKLALERKHLVGVDYFKLYMPEFNLIQEVADGRASVTVQKECKMLADQLFHRLIEDQRSFIWDSSMSDKAETIKKINLANKQGYELSMIAVLTPVEVATLRAMDRAKETRRFPHVEALPKSHAAFRQSFMDYVPLFDEITVFANSDNLGDDPLVIAEKTDKKALVIHAPDVFNPLLSVKKTQ